MKIHPKVEQVRRLIEGLRPEIRKTLAHVIDCPKCREAFDDLPGGIDPAGAPKVLEWRPLEELVEGGGEPDAPPVPAAAASKSRPAGEMDDLSLAILASVAWEGDGPPSPESRWRSAEFLLEESRKLRMEDPWSAETLALEALHLTEELDGSIYGPKLVMDLRALAWTSVSGARLAAADLRGSEEALQVAAGFLEKGSGDLLESAVFLEAQGVLRKDQRRLEEAEALLLRSSAQFTAIGDAHGIGRVMVNLANVFWERGEVDRSIQCLQQAASEVGPDADPILLLSIRHNLAGNLVDAGAYSEAQAVLAESEDLYRNQAGTVFLLRRRWIEAKLARATGELEVAEGAYLEVREGFIEEGMGYDAALVSVELATLYAEQGRFSEMRRLANEMLPIFRAHDIHREALAALVIFQQAARMESVTLKLTREVADYLKRARDNPELRFELGK